ncbi:hypothetical protein SCLCIDRAFT_1219275 [Scleroderma citrinum Foug A]|uniref:Uncharacterized protein n=1 Tax=Scleroderma citrinum Foug A TaxID=1036808 RepID=A0A0C3DNN5_9AGAM|nr:hypothetical protein SCLCIDRAFT_1219275 [Scleroderma citrinum Foug A]
MCTPSSPEVASGSASPIRISVCDVPVLAPRPLPYHSPTFLQFDLPDTDEDLSHPPYTHRPAKRKRTDDGDQIHDDDLPPPPPAKRRAHQIHAWRSRVHREHQLQLPSPRHQRQLLHHGAWFDLVPLRPPPASAHRSSGLPFADQPFGYP